MLGSWAFGWIFLAPSCLLLLLGTAIEASLIPPKLNLGLTRRHLALLLPVGLAIFELFIGARFSVRLRDWHRSAMAEWVLYATLLLSLVASPFLLIWARKPRILAAAILLAAQWACLLACFMALIAVTGDGP